VPRFHVGAEIAFGQEEPMCHSSQVETGIMNCDRTHGNTVLGIVSL
jgi:hypothetical protein